MNRTNIQNLNYDVPSFVGGLITRVKDTKYMVFIMLQDISGSVQISIDKGTQQSLVADALKLTVGSFATFEGTLKKNDFVKQGGKEFIPTSIKIETISDVIPVDENSLLDQRIDFRWVDLRDEKKSLIFKIETLVANSMRNYLVGKDYIEIHSPKLIKTASESGSEVFEVKYFDGKAYLAQSPQFYKQMAMASGFERVFEVGPVFRAENSNTSKHATEFTGFDLECSYLYKVEDVMYIEEELLTVALKSVKEKYGEEIKRLYNIDVKVPDGHFPVMTLSEVYDELKARYNYEVPESAKSDLTTEGERLCEKLSMEKFGSEFLFITKYPKEKRAFYHMRDENGVPMGYDLIWKGVEITTGAIREHRHDILKQQAEEKGLGKDVQFYLEFFKYGCPPHGGFGLGLDRFMMVLLGLSVKEVMFIFRGPQRLNP